MLILKGNVSVALSLSSGYKLGPLDNFAQVHYKLSMVTLRFLAAGWTVDLSDLF